MAEESQPRVVLTPCTDYQEARVEAAVQASLAALGGMERFVQPGQRVFLKVNLLMAKEIDRAITTHPAVVKAVVKQIQAAGGSVIIGDSPGGPYSVSGLKRSYRLSGMEQVAAETGAALNFDLGAVELTHPAGKVLKRATIIRPLADADVVITLPKLKTHGLTKFTGGVKILFGAIPGLLKAEYHLRMPDVRDFSDMLLDLVTLVKPRLSIMDGVVGMEGEGPSAGKPKQVGLLLASTDSVALDVVACAVVGIPPEEATTTRAAMARGLTTGRVEDIDLVGPPLSAVKLTDFETVGKGGDFVHRMPGFVHGLAYALLRPKPVTNQQLCNGCGTCANVCPAQAITMIGHRPRTDYDKCIRCFCCQELCPQSAVMIQRPWAGRMVFRV